MKNGYNLLANGNTATSRVATTAHTGNNACPRITRTKLLCAFLVVFAFGLLIIFQCIGSRFSKLCCPSSKKVEAHIDRGTDTITNAGATEQDERLLSGLRMKNFEEHVTVSDNRGYYKKTAQKAEPQQRRRFPGLIIIGVRKGGTRALLEFLNLHPQIVAEKAEMHFFDDDDIYSNGLEWYRRKMPYTYPDQITIEKTPAYFTEEAVPERVYRMNRTCKFLIVIRDPTERAISDYTQIYFNKRDKGKGFESFEELAVDIYGMVNKSYKAIRRSMYYKHMERWLNFFPLKQFHIVDGAKLVDDPVPELKKVEDFMGLEHKLTKDRFYYNSTRGFYCMKLEHKEKCLAKSKGRTHPDVDPKVVKILHRFFKPLNQKFYSIVQQDFGWPSE